MKMKIKNRWLFALKMNLFLNFLLIYMEKVATITEGILFETAMLILLLAIMFGVYSFIKYFAYTQQGTVLLGLHMFLMPIYFLKDVIESINLGITSLEIYFYLVVFLISGYYWYCSLELYLENKENYELKLKDK